ncbi:MAG: hypothetical protein K2X48_02320 [Chitinophagaceae bacterium]|nr:hypothetical protein [Chitinophagaceae bacterium]
MTWQVNKVGDDSVSFGELKKENQPVSVKTKLYLALTGLLLIAKDLLQNESGLLPLTCEVISQHLDKWLIS